MKRNLILITLLCSYLFTAQAQISESFTKLPNWLWGEYLTSGGSWPMDLHPDLFVYTGVEGYVSEMEEKNDTLELTVSPLNKKKESKTVWMILGDEGKIEVSTDGKRFSKLSKAINPRRKTIPVQEFIKPALGKWYRADTGEEFLEIKTEELILEGQVYKYNEVIHIDNTRQLNISGPEFGRFVHGKFDGALYSNFMVKGIGNVFCKRSADLPKQRSNAFEEFKKDVKGTFYSIDGKNTPVKFEAYTLTLNGETYPIKKLTKEGETACIRISMDEKDVEYRIKPFNQDYCYLQRWHETPTLIKQSIGLADGAEVKNPFLGNWFSTNNNTELLIYEGVLGGEALGKEKYKRVLFDGSAYHFMKKNKVIVSVKRINKDYCEITKKKKTELFKSNKGDANRAVVKQLPKNYYKSWFTKEGDFIYRFYTDALAMDKRFWTIDKITYANQNYHLSASYLDTVCYYNEAGDYLCEIKDVSKTLVLSENEAGTLKINQLNSSEEPFVYTQSKPAAKGDSIIFGTPGIAVLLGRVDYPNKLRSKALPFYVEDILYDDQKKYTVTVDDEGYFKLEVPMVSAQSVWTRMGNNQSILLTPNDTVLICLNAYNYLKAETWDVMGANAQLITERFPYTTKKYKYVGRRYKLYEKNYALEPEKFAVLMDSLLHEDLAFLNNYTEKSKSSEAFKSYSKNEIHIENWDDRMRFRWMRDSRKAGERFEEHETYFSFLDTINFADKYLWAHHDFQNLTHEVYYRNRNLTRTSITIKDVVNEVVKVDESISAEWKATILKLADNYRPSEVERDTINAIFKRNQEAIQALSERKKSETKNSITNTDNGAILADVFACNNFYRKLETGNEIEKAWEELIMSVVDEAFLQHMKVEYDKELAIKNQELPEYCLMNYPAKTSGDVFLKDLAKKHAGYVVYIDVWAPWCSPCRSEFEHAPALKKAMEGKPVHFVYLCGSGGKTAHENCIKKYNIAGDHYYMERDTYEEICGKFGISGIPTFMIMDKNGNIIDDKAPRPSSRSTIVNVLKKLCEDGTEDAAQK